MFCIHLSKAIGYFWEQRFANFQRIKNLTKCCTIQRSDKIFSTMGNLQPMKGRHQPRRQSGLLGRAEPQKSYSLPKITFFIENLRRGSEKSRSGLAHPLATGLEGMLKTVESFYNLLHLFSERSLLNANIGLLLQTPFRHYRVPLFHRMGQLDIFDISECFHCQARQCNF